VKLLLFLFSLCGYFYLDFLFDRTFSGTGLGRELRAYLGYISYQNFSGLCENLVIMETYIVIGYNLTSVLSILLIICAEFKHILNVIIWFVLI